jgi:aminoglycoside phosphotransferase (APT) family kinase protein
MVTERAGPPAVAIPAWVTAALGARLSDVARLPWGFTNETWAATAPTGERFAVTRMRSGGAAAFVVGRGPAIARRLAAAGLDVPIPDVARSLRAKRVVVSSWIEGTPAMLRLDGPAGAEAVGRAAALAWRRLADVDATGLALDVTWARPEALASAASAWLETVRSETSSTTTAVVERLIETTRPTSPAARASIPTAFVHGDLVPANVLLRDTGVALLDLESARMGDPLLDAAWFRWIVAYHHPALAPAAWGGFAVAAGLADLSGSQEARLAAYPVLRILEILATAGLQPLPRRRWLAQLDAATALAEPGSTLARNPG